MVTKKVMVNTGLEHTISNVRIITTADSMLYVGLGNDFWGEIRACTGVRSGLGGGENRFIQCMM